MSDGSTIIRQRQLAVRREMDRRGISLKAAAFDSGIPYATLATYLPADRHAEPAQIPGGAIYSIIAGDALPLDLVSMLMPDGAQIVRACEGIDHDEVATAVCEYMADKAKAHHPESEDGPAIGPTERKGLNAKVVQIAAKAAA